MYICICNGVTDDQIRAEVYRGACSLREISERLEVATSCGKCGKCARKLVRETLREAREVPLMAGLPASSEWDCVVPPRKPSGPSIGSITPAPGSGAAIKLPKLSAV